MTNPSLQFKLIQGIRQLQLEKQSKINYDKVAESFKERNKYNKTTDK